MHSAEHIGRFVDELFCLAKGKCPCICPNVVAAIAMAVFVSLLSFFILLNIRAHVAATDDLSMMSYREAMASPSKSSGKKPWPMKRGH